MFTDALGRHFTLKLGLAALLKENEGEPRTGAPIETVS